ncbi:response regulator [Desertivirga xinjiangensis]|uniref:response regulator n=1 Tax=Desertivirga xinjiangensis TaxID=539206 RepID=UPI00210AA21F|nr:response regulator [Pedobacter xinjiangensis]
MRKILIIDDDEDFREDVSEILLLSNYVTLLAEDGKSGVEKALREKPDIILCDVSMPNLDGFSVFHILSRHPETGGIPFIFMTGRNAIADIRRGMSMGADDYLVKPFDETDLLNSVEMRLNKNNGSKGKLTDAQQMLVTFIREVQQRGSNFLPNAEIQVQSYKKRHILYSDGQKASAVYFVVSGKIKEYMINNQGKELITNMYGRGDFIGHASVLENSPYTESAQVIEAAKLLVLPKKDFLHIIQNNLQIASSFIGVLSHSLLLKDLKLMQFAYSNLRKKVATGILEVVDKFRDQNNGMPAVEISREDLANVVGAAQESLSRTLKEFKSERLIALSDGDIIILDVDRLRNMAH